MVPITVCYLESRTVDGMTDLWVEKAHPGIDLRGCRLYETEAADKDTGKTDTTDGKVLDSSLSLGSVESIFWNFDVAKRVFFDSEFCHRMQFKNAEVPRARCRHQEGGPKITSV